VQEGGSRQERTPCCFGVFGHRHASGRRVPCQVPSQLVQSQCASWVQTEQREIAQAACCVLRRSAQVVLPRACKAGQQRVCDSNSSCPAGRARQKRASSGQHSISCKRACPAPCLSRHSTRRRHTSERVGLEHACRCLRLRRTSRLPRGIKCVLALPMRVSMRKHDPHVAFGMQKHDQRAACRIRGLQMQAVGGTAAPRRKTCALSSAA
jgi:hypothetical protein